MNAETFCEQFATFAEAPNGVAKLRELILQLAVQGKLVPQDVNDEPASVSQRDDQSREGEAPAEPQRAKRRQSSIAARQEPRPPDPDTTVGDFAEIQNGYAFKSEWFVPQGIRLVRNVNVGHDELRWDETARVTPDIAQQFDRFNLNEGDIVISLDRPLITTGLKVARISRDDLPCLLLQRVGRVVFKYEDVLPEYFFLWLHSPAFTATIDPGRSNGVPHISAREIEAIPFSLPPLAEQRRIVGKVDQLLGLCDELALRQAARREARSALVGATLDRLVSARSAAEFPAHAHRLRDHFDRLFDTPTTLPQLRQAILQLAVQGQLVPQDPNDEPVETLLITAERKKAKWEGPIDEQEVPFQLPPSWKWFRLGDISMLKHGYAFSSQFFTSEPAPFVLTTPGNFYEKGGFRDRESKRKYYSGPVDPEFILKPGDLIIPMTEQAAGLLGSPAFIPDDGRVYVHNQRLGKLSFSELIAPEFAFWFFNSEFFRGELARTCTGMKVRHTSPDRVLRVPFPVPPLSEQKRIVSKVTELLSLCDALEAKLTQAESASTQLLSAAVHHLLSDSTANGKAASCPM